MDGETSFTHEIDYNPKPEDAGTIKIYASIVGVVDHVLTTYPIIYRSADDYDAAYRSGGNQLLKDFLKDAGIDTQVLCDLYLCVDEIVFLSGRYTPDCALSVRMTIDPITPQIEQEEEVVAAIPPVSWNQTNNRPVSKLALMSLDQKIYVKNKNSSKCDDATCSICLEEFTTGKRLVILPCGHLFDAFCVADWFSINHVCPLCRFELPYET
ncbi:hypothetical protein ARALYDRAFT_898399 [Arabidopsis lyrata subsp. lyrata]|uniref:RING-type domain-containing protein n=1 Tax=Arabidopsis lyrata subsp. lyrata TaxID=81972 RepID=D7LAU5_ARALL|nr:E3 ubiquitin ligase BIG BROTHER [Arabidopsis lyrata subsp. lyrata]EFH59475.1 hypothetical protein ARALYDRAFT_898399 [Arabidopsis lyrata subsp. lyrata]|eukprot:XP_002883216.1 E3 ubiquitin ligase BIG BROTHER [Arabidopsis lyrata subsp. lyrata]